jgi:hypothetical protein
VPWVVIKTGFISTDGQETVLREYLCDSPNCGEVAEHLVGVARDVPMMRAVCLQHAAVMRGRPASAKTD